MRARETESRIVKEIERYVYRMGMYMPVHSHQHRHIQVNTSAIFTSVVNSVVVLISFLFVTAH